MARLPIPGADDGNWGEILNEHVSQALKSDGSIKDNVITASSIAPNTLTVTEIENSTITESKLDPSVQAKLNSQGATGPIGATGASGQSITVTLVAESDWAALPVDTGPTHRYVKVSD